MTKVNLVITVVSSVTLWPLVLTLKSAMLYLLTLAARADVTKVYTTTQSVPCYSVSDAVLIPILLILA